MSVRKRFWSLVLSIGCVSSSAWASPPPALHVQGPAEGCPTPRTLIVELKRLLPQTRFETAPDAGAETVQIEDGGESFSVSVGGETRRFDDASRECTERARLAAVFVALVLDPLHVPLAETKSEPPPPEPPPPEPEPEPEPPPPPEPEPPSDESSIDFEIGPLLWVGAVSNSQNLPVAGGLGGRFRFGGSVGVSVGGAGLLPAHLQYGEADVEAIWTPFDVSLRLSQRLNEWELSGELGPLAAWVSIAGQGVLDARAATRLEVGGRVGASVRYWASPNIALFLAGHGAFFPRPYHLELAGLGEVGRTPTLWVGTTIGAVIDLD